MPVFFLAIGRMFVTIFMQCMLLITRLCRNAFADISPPPWKCDSNGKFTVFHYLLRFVQCFFFLCIFPDEKISTKLMWIPSTDQTEYLHSGLISISFSFSVVNWYWARKKRFPINCSGATASISVQCNQTVCSVISLNTKYFLKKSRSTCNSL